MQQGEFLVGQVDALALTGDAAAQQVQLQVGDVETFDLARRAATQQGAYPRQQLGIGKRLDQIVVGAQFQPAHPVFHRIAGGEEQHRRVRRALAHHLHQLPAIEPGQHDVEDYQIERFLLDQVFAVDAVARDLHPVAGLLQPSLEVVGRLGLVLYHQNSHRITSLMAHRLWGQRLGSHYKSVMRWQRF